FIDQFDHSICMNTADPAYADFKERYDQHVIGFENEDPTTEVMAKTIYDELVRALANFPGDDRYPFRPDEVKVIKVRVWETSASWAEYGE
ncbi:MAG: 6-carboxytetrahydropterin synthase, partial [Verrucomicrobiota bacterium]